MEVNDKGFKDDKKQGENLKRKGPKFKYPKIKHGVTDDQLRPAFSRLVRSTKDVEEAQNLLNLALDLASATGKPLEVVTNALGKAYDGNTTALSKFLSSKSN